MKFAKWLTLMWIGLFIPCWLVAYSIAHSAHLSAVTPGLAVIGLLAIVGTLLLVFGAPLVALAWLGGLLWWWLSRKQKAREAEAMLRHLVSMRQAGDAVGASQGTSGGTP